MAHSWQFRHGGAEYLSEAVLSYVDDKDAAYDYGRALDEQTPWDELTPDQQAEFAMLIGMARANDTPGDLTATSLGEAIADERNLAPPATVAVSVDQLAYVNAIRLRLLAGDL